jgi:hypothetical protein
MTTLWRRKKSQGRATLAGMEWLQSPKITPAQEEGVDKLHMWPHYPVCTPPLA